MIIQEFYSNMHGFDYFVPYFITSVRGTRIVVTLDLISEVLHVPRVEFADYLSGSCLRIVSKDELMSLFCETPSSSGDHQNTPCSAFAKGPRFLNMMMTFVLHPCLTIILLLSLVLAFCCLSSRTLLLTFSLTSYSPL